MVPGAYPRGPIGSSCNRDPCSCATDPAAAQNCQLRVRCWGCFLLGVAFEVSPEALALPLAPSRKRRAEGWWWWQSPWAWMLPSLMVPFISHEQQRLGAGSIASPLEFATFSESLHSL